MAQSQLSKSFNLLAFATLISFTGCLYEPKTFDELIAGATKLAAETSHSDEFNTLNVRIEETDRQLHTITFAIDDTSHGKSSTSTAVVGWAIRDNSWRVTSMTSDWSEFGMLSIIIEQQLINKICRKLDDEYVPPKSDPQKSAETLEAMEEIFQFTGEQEEP